MDSIREILINYQHLLLDKINDEFYRSINCKVDWNARMVSLKGPRGAGKTTLML